MRRLPKKLKTYPNDTNLLSWLFMVARDDALLTRALHIIQFIRDHPNLPEEDVRIELDQLQLRNMPPKRTRSP